MTKTRPVKKASADPSQTGPLRSGESNSVRVLASPLSPHNHLDLDHQLLQKSPERHSGLTVSETLWTNVAFTTKHL
jgi:hypothetical protein